MSIVRFRCVALYCVVNEMIIKHDFILLGFFFGIRVNFA